MARRRDPTVKSILKALKIDPVRELAEAAMQHEKGSKERLDIMRELLPWVHYKPRPPVEVETDGKPGTTVVVIGGTEG